MCSIICTIPQGLLRAAGCTEWSIRAKLAAEPRKPGAQRKVPAFMVTATPKRNVPFNSGQSTSCATKIKTQRPVSPASQTDCGALTCGQGMLLPWQHGAGSFRRRQTTRPKMPYYIYAWLKPTAGFHTPLGVSPSTIAQKWRTETGV